MTGLSNPVPVMNADGSTSPGQTIGRLVTPSHNSEINKGDFYMKFHVQVTRP